jgi:hypothetical protein
MRHRPPSKRSKRERRLTVVISDCHHPKVDKSAWKIVLAAVKDLQPDGLYLMGDFLDMATVSTHHELADTDVGLTLKREFDAGNKALDQLDEVAIGAWDRLWLEGNHCLRLARWKANSCPGAIRDSIPTIDEALRLRERGYRSVLGRDQPVKVGNLHLLHGHFFNQAHAQKHLTTMGVNEAYGHVHTPQQMTTYTMNGNIQATCFPCLRTLQREWVHMSKIHTWTLGFGVIEWVGDHAFPRNVFIIDGRAVYGGWVWRA